jgi:hypothetical protein
MEKTEKTEPTAEAMRAVNQQKFEFGGLRFDVAFRAVAGATLRVDGKVDGEWKELLRFDDFIDVPHYHAPADAHQIDFDRATLGEPLVWYIAQIRDHLPEWLTKSGFADVVPTVDMKAVVDNIDKVEEAMRNCVPDGFVRVPGVGIQRVPANAAG